MAVCPYLTHRDPRLWADPGLFRPQRFVDPPQRPALGTVTTRSASARAACLGAQFGLREMAVLAETLLPAFDFALTTAPPGPVFDLTVRPDGPSSRPSPHGTPAADLLGAGVRGRVSSRGGGQ